MKRRNVVAAPLLSTISLRVVKALRKGSLSIGIKGKESEMDIGSWEIEI